MNENEYMGCRVIHISTTDSTNEEIKRLHEVLPEGAVVMSDTQTMGRGRLGRKWSSPDNGGLWMSFILRPDILPSSCSGITLVAAVSMALTIRRITGLEVEIKWPNDLVVKGKKLGGILTEMVMKDDKVDYIVVGIGLNMNVEEFPEEIKEVATSLNKELLNVPDRFSLIKTFGEFFEGYYGNYKAVENMSLMKDEYERLLVNCDREVTVIEKSGSYNGIARGITELGELIVETDGEFKTIRSGEVSVRGVYGYV